MIPANNKRSKKSAAQKKTSPRVGDYSNDPYFEKKAEESKAFLEKHGFPAEVMKKK